ncbi:hypothetical protein BD309DRAFT_622853 [Dichomitus squalens]|uniref:Uncharacterized protein n=1 Tax=Dichomitus squalens TaxID=114155 RepID=A0A4Q9P1J3_9APHY|nr:hypothetical protein BD309DRAFT_622853 [Dichomitus squalens]TBU63294.1 hypothetical protein BD310DRAFT_808920 [Dichomitus squalens]
MPARRASAGHNIASTSRVHRSNGSNHSISAQSPVLQSSNLPYSSNIPPSPQQKVVQVLINRLKNKLPCNSGISLTELEADDAVQQTVEALVDLSRDSLDMISLALTEQLERLAKQIEGAGYRGVDILQSQLFLLKVLALAMASRWGSRVEDTRPSSRTSKPAPGSKPTTPDSSIPTSDRGRHPSSDQLSTNTPTLVSVATPTLVEPPALDDNCAKYIISVMVLLLRQASPRRNRLTSATNLSFDASFQDMESVESHEFGANDEAPLNLPNIMSGVPRTMNRAKHPSLASLNSGGKTSSISSRLPQHSAAYERTSFLVAKSVLSLHCAIAKYTGRIVYHLSASNWSVVLGRIRQRIHGLASTADAEPDTVDLQLITYSALDRNKLVQSLQELSSLLMNLKKDAQVPVSIALRTAVWNWIELCDDEYNDALRYHRRLDGAPERVFDLLYDLQESSRDKAGAWPTLAVLLCVSGDRMKAEYEANALVGQQRGARKERNITDLIIKNLPFGSRYFDVALVCAVDICRAASRVRPRADSENEVPLISMAYDIAHELKIALLKWTKDKPFWECPDEIEVALVSDALAALYRFLPEEESLGIFQQCLEPERSDAVKLCVMKACLTLVVDGWKLPWQRPLATLKNHVMKRMNTIFYATYVRRSEVDANGSSRKPSMRPKAKRYTSEILPDRELLILAILTLWRADFEWYIDSQPDEIIDNFFSLCVSVYITPADPAIRWSLGRTFRCFMEYILSCPKDHPRWDLMSRWVSEAVPAVLASVASHLLNTRTDLQTQRMLIHFAYEFMYRYAERDPPSQYSELRMMPTRIPAFALAEIAFLVCLSSADGIVSLTACNCLRLLAQAERQPDAPQPPELSEDEVLKRHPVYEQLGDPKVSMIGRVGHQKRIRKLMRLLTSPSAIHVAVWQELYFRWCALTEMTVRQTFEQASDGLDNGPAPVGDKTLPMEERQAQWQNLTLLLASLGAACTRDHHDPSALAKVIPASIIPDSCRVLRDPSDLLTNFLTETVNLLVNDLPQVRDVAREALSNEASHRLYGKIVKQLDDVIRQVTDDENVNYPVLVVFLDQFIAILKVLSDNVNSLAEDLRVADIPSLLYTVATFISRIDGADPTSARLKLKFCVLCNSVFSRTEPVMMRNKESSMRQSIIDIIIDWVQETTLEEAQASTVQHELNVAVFNTTVTLFDRLQLEPSDGATGEDAAHAVSRLFIRYASFLIKTWESVRYDGNSKDDGISEKSSFSKIRIQQREGEYREQLINGLSSLVSANTECGVKHCLTLAYEPDSTKRLIFTHVFIRVLKEGIKFMPYEETPVIVKQSPLCELVKGPDMALALAICEICPPNEVDAMNAVLLNLFDTRSTLMNLLKTMIDLEIGKTESDTALFRGNSTCTRFLSAFARVYGYNYLRSLIVPLVKLVTTMPPGHGYELDPARVSREELKQNKDTVEFITGKFLEIISSSIPALPSIIREICAHIAKAVNEVWPEAKFAALGAFIFLRFISPAIVTPETVDVAIPNNDPTIRRGLMVIAKIIQNLANNILFGKEAHMVILNDFLKDNIVTVTKFLSEINKHVPPGSEEEADEWLERTYDDTDTIILHRFFERHADKIGKELLSSSKVLAEKMTPEAEAAAANGKRAWDALCAALVELGQPLESPKLSTLTSREHRDYLDLMSRCDRRDTTAVQELFVEGITPQSSNAVFVLSVSKINIEVLDLELLLYYIFKCITSSTNDNRDFDVILDFTAFSSTSQVPAQWLKFATETIPVDIWRRFQTLRLLTPNGFALRYLRRLYNNLTSGATESLHIAIHTSVGELLSQYPDGLTAASLGYAVGLEAEISDEFQDVTMRHTHPMRVPVSMRVAQSHIRIITTKALTISNSLSSKATEIIPLSDINDVYNVSTGHDSHEFIIRKVRQGVTMYFSSPYRDAIVKAIRAAKGLMLTAHLPSADRHDRLSNVITTLLRIALVGISTDDETRTASFELLSAICTYLDFEGRPAVPSKGVVATGHPGPFLVMVSEGLSNHVPQLTMDFLSEMAGNIAKMDVPLRANCLQYLCPWIKNLALFTDPCSKFYEPSGTRFRDCIRMLVDLTTGETELHSFVQKFIWFEVGKLETNTINIILDELMRAAVDGGMGSSRCEKVADTMSALNTINVRGRVLARVRKVIGKTSIKPTRNLSENVHWNEIACLTRLILVIGNSAKNTVQSQLFVPEIMHLVTLIAATGELYVRSTVYAIITHMLHAMCSLRLTDATASPEIEALLDECCQPEGLRLFGLSRPTPTSEYVIYDPPNGKALIDDLEALTKLLVRIMQAISGTKGLLNVWRARWMSLITSSAFQLSPAVQSRAFVALGVLAKSDVDDDLLYQMLVAFKTALSQASETDTTSVVSMLRCITNVVPATNGNSRYLAQLFWLAVALLQSSHMALYVEAIRLLRVTVENMAEHGHFKERGVPATLLEGRVALEDIACQLDHLLGLSFDSSFSFSLAATVFKGVRHSALRDAAEGALRSLLNITVRSCVEVEHADDGPGAPICHDVLGYVLALIPMSTRVRSFKRLLEEANVDQSWLSEDAVWSTDEEDSVYRMPFGLIGYADSNTALLVTSFVTAMLATAQGDDTESAILYNILSDVADAWPEVIGVAYESLQDKIKETFANSNSPVILLAVSNVFRVATQDMERTAPPSSRTLAGAGSASTLSTVDEGVVHGPGRRHLNALEEQGMQGLVNSFQFLPLNRGHATKMIQWISELVMKMIE